MNRDYNHFCKNCNGAMFALFFLFREMAFFHVQQTHSSHPEKMSHLHFCARLFTQTHTLSYFPSLCLYVPGSATFSTILNLWKYPTVFSSVPFCSSRHLQPFPCNFEHVLFSTWILLFVVILKFWIHYFDILLRISLSFFTFCAQKE